MNMNDYDQSQSLVQKTPWPKIRRQISAARLSASSVTWARKDMSKETPASNRVPKARAII